MVSPSTVFIPNQNVLCKVYVANPNDTSHSVKVRSRASNPTGCEEEPELPKCGFEYPFIHGPRCFFTPPSHVEIMSAIHSAQPCDLNGDGKADLVW